MEAIGARDFAGIMIGVVRPLLHWEQILPKSDRNEKGTAVVLFITPGASPVAAISFSLNFSSGSNK